MNRIRSRAALLLSAALLAACARESRQSPGPVARPEDRVTVQVQKTDDLYLLINRYVEVLQQDRPATFEVEIGADMVGTPVMLSPPTELRGRDVRVDVVVRGPASGPVVVRGMDLQVTARNVTVRGLIFAGGRGGSLLRATVADSVRIEKCHFVDNWIGTPFNAALVETAGMGKGPFRVDVEDSTFVRNMENGPGAMLAFGSGQYHLDHVRFERVAFVDNTWTRGVSVGVAKDVSFADGLVYQKAHRNPGATSTLFALQVGPKDFEIEKSTVIVDSPARLAAQAGGSPKSLTLRKSKLFAIDPAAPAAAVPGVKLDGTAAERGDWAARDKAISDALDAAIKAPAQAPRDVAGWARLIGP